MLLGDILPCEDLSLSLSLHLFKHMVGENFFFMLVFCAKEFRIETQDVFPVQSRAALTDVSSVSR